MRTHFRIDMVTNLDYAKTRYRLYASTYDTEIGKHHPAVTLGNHDRLLFALEQLEDISPEAIQQLDF